MKKFLFVFALILFMVGGLFSQAVGIDQFEVHLWKLNEGQVVVPDSLKFMNDATLDLSWQWEAVAGNMSTPPTSYTVTGEEFNEIVDNVPALWTGDVATIVREFNLTRGTWLINIRPVRLGPPVEYGGWAMEELVMFLDTEVGRTFRLRINLGG